MTGTVTSGLKDRRHSARLLLPRIAKWGAGIFAVLITLLFIYSWWDGRNMQAIAEESLDSMGSVSLTEGRGVSDLFSSRQEDLAPDLKQKIESLFSAIEGNPENRDILVHQLKRLLRENFEGQEDCWSCVGAEYFDRFDAIVGENASRKPMGLKEWISLGDEAFENARMDEARKYYTEALQVMDERVFQPEESVDEQSLERLNSRCLQLDCR